MRSYLSREISHLSSQQKLPMTKTEIETVLKRLDGLDLGKNDGDAVGTQVDDNESKRHTRLSELVPRTKHGPLPILILFKLSQEGGE